MAETKPKYTREAVQKLHSEGYTDIYIGDLFGKTAFEISKARKKSSYWEERTAPPVAESSTEENAPEVVEQSAAGKEKAPETLSKGNKKNPQ